MRQRSYPGVLPIILLPVLLRLPAWLLGLSDSPLWSTALIAIPGPAPLLPGLPGFLDLNAGWTTQALGGLAARQWLSGQVPWWDPFAGIGVPLAAEMQSAALFLPYVLLLALPSGVLLLALSLQWTAGLAAWRLLLRLRVSPLAATLGALSFELGSCFAWVGPPSAMPMAFLPMFLLGLERAREAAQTRGGGYRTIAAAVAWSLYAGFPETAYLDGLLALAWAIGRGASLPGHRAAFALRVAGGGVAGLLLAAPLLGPFFQLLAAASLGPRDGIDMAALALPVEGLSQLLTPYALGLPAGLSDADPSGTLFVLWGRAGGYLGLGLALAALLGGTAPGPYRLLRSLLLAWTLVLLARIVGVPVVRGLFDLVPFHRQLQVFRYAGAAWLLPCCLLAAFAVDLPRQAWRVWGIAALLTLAAGAALATAWPLAHTVAGAPAYLWLSAGWGVCSLSMTAAVFAGARPRSIAVALTLDSALLFIVPQAARQRQPIVDQPAIKVLQRLGLQRFATLGPFQPNYPGLFGIASVNTNILPAPALWSDHVQAHLRPGGDGTLFNGMFPPDQLGMPTNADILRQHLPEYAALGVRYILASPGANPFGVFPTWPRTPQAAVTLDAGAELSGPLQAPGPVSGLAVLIGTFEGQSDGTVDATACGTGGCAQASASLVGAIDNGPLILPLDHVLAASDTYTFTLRHTGGRPVAVWRDERGGNLKVAAIAAPAPDAPALVFSGASMTIYEVAAWSPYWSATDGPCSLTALSRTEVQAECAAPATLVRRELSLAGWHARVWQGSAEPAAQDPAEGGLFQRVSLPAGRSRVAFRYSPPGLPGYLVLFCLGAVAMMPWRRLHALSRRSA